MQLSRKIQERALHLGRATAVRPATWLDGPASHRLPESVPRLIFCLDLLHNRGRAIPMPSLLERLRAVLAPKFTVEREIASGGMGTVFRGHDLALDRPVAIKVLRPELSTAVAAERF